MPDQAPTRHLPPIARWTLVALLLLALLLVGVYNDTLILFFTALWRQGLAAAGLRQQTEALQHGLGNNLSARFLPAAATYSGLYVGLCLLLLRLLLPTLAQWHLALRLYLGALVLFVAMVVLSKLTGAAWAYGISRDFLDFVVSPLPVAGLYVLFRTGYGLPASD
ncbi:XrtX-associated membrane protein [Hymenobacter rubidus]|uniref:XrtX-associated membrane protein n=1 Tax=Hymenobacter rubidus TaxID=1441626 RepID=UPI00191E55E8|nr:hypothetical protein [Hymenobacter rubidus]